jgi:chromosome segregation ATPase
VSETTDNRGPNMKHIQHQEEIRELEATCEGLDSYAAVCVANVLQLESRVRELEDEVARLSQVPTPDGFGESVTRLEAERDRLKDEIGDLNTELRLSNARLLFNPLPGDNLIHDEGEIRRLYNEISTLRARHAALVEEKESAQVLYLEKCDTYNELIFAVGNKYPNESRHETALRYIRNAENPTDNITHQAALAEVKV